MEFKIRIWPLICFASLAKYVGQLDRHLSFPNQCLERTSFIRPHILLSIVQMGLSRQKSVLVLRKALEDGQHQRRVIAPAGMHHGRCAVFLQCAVVSVTHILISKIGHKLCGDHLHSSWIGTSFFSIQSENVQAVFGQIVLSSNLYGYK